MKLENLKLQLLQYFGLFTNTIQFRSWEIIEYPSMPVFIRHTCTVRIWAKVESTGHEIVLFQKIKSSCLTLEYF